jgi:peptide/nickel transport system substrate-binding protein
MHDVGRSAVKRRAFLRSAAGALAAAGTMAAPTYLARAATPVLRFVPTADLASLDPIWYGARNAGLLIWDILYGVDSELRPQRQMVESEELSGDGLTWTFRLRQGSRSTMTNRRWPRTRLRASTARDFMGGMIKAVENEFVAVDDPFFVGR